MLTTPASPPALADARTCFLRQGWLCFARDPALDAWVDAVRPHALAALDDPAHAHWYRYGATWFAGVNVLENDEAGRIADGPSLGGAAVAFLDDALGLRAGEDFVWDRGQVSVCLPGYPKPMAEESAGAFNYRVHRDAAHVDGIHPVGTPRRRHIREPHGFVIGIPLTQADAGASPLVVWEGSHRVMQQALQQTLRDVPTVTWPDVDVTEIYQATRQRIFETCRRVVINVPPGCCYLVHRLALHGVAPWVDGASADERGRAIVYFRPEPREDARAEPGSVLSRWLNAE
ncbi:MAG: hypothetical protein AAGJ70_04725 [Pseudomonadota bacterium]